MKKKKKGSGLFWRGEGGGGCSKEGLQEAQCAHAPSFVRSAFASHSGHLTILAIF